MTRESKPVRKAGVTPKLIVVVSVVAVVGAALFVLNALSSSQQPTSGCRGITCGFEWGTPVNATDSGIPECPLNYCYVVEIAGTGAGNASLSELHLSLLTRSGQPMPWPSAGTGSGIDSVLLVQTVNNKSCATYDEFTGTWNWNSSFSGSVSEGYAILIHTGGVGSLYGLRGDSLGESGLGGTHGLVVSAPFP